MFWRIIRYTKPVMIPVLERYFRLKDRIRLGILRLTGRSTVRDILNEQHLAGGRFVIFSTYPTMKLAAAHVRLLRKFQMRGYAILCVTNHPKPHVVLKSCQAEPWTFMLRRPFGRDFGGFKDASLLLQRYQADGRGDIERVIYLNDSIMTFSATEEGIIDHLDNDDIPFAGITENYHRSHHVGSFAMSVSGDVFNHPVVRRYWKRYTPISTRRYAIGRGELGFSKAVRRAGFIPDVRWTLTRIKAILAEKDLVFITKIASSMEPHFRRLIESPVAIADNRMRSFFGQTPSSSAGGGKGKKGSAGRSAAAIITGSSFPSLGQVADADFAPPANLIASREQYMGLSAEAQRRLSRESAREELIDVIVKYIFRGSNIHHGAAVLLFLGAGIIKKDLVLRRILEPFNVTTLLRESHACTGTELEEVTSEILAKGHPYSLRGKARLLHDWDFT